MSHAAHKSVTQDFVRNITQTSGPRTGFAAYARAVRRYGFETETFVARNGVVFRKKKPAEPAAGVVVMKDDSTETEVPALDIQNDLEYVVPVTIGTPGVTLNLDFDTGSSDLWVWSSEIRSSTSGHTIYNPKNSSTSAVVSGATWNISYKDGSSASGDVYLDTIKIGTVTLPGQGIELASKLSKSFLNDGGSDGLLGLAFPSKNTVTPTKQNTPVQNLIDKGILAASLFTVMLDKGDSNGFYSFGEIDTARAGVIDDDIFYTPVDSSGGNWMFDSTTLSINGKQISRPSNKAVVDTGTTLCLLDDTSLSSIYNTVPGAVLDDNGHWIYPNDAIVPTIQLAVGATMFTVSAEYFGYGPSKSGFTYGSFQTRGTLGLDLFGDVFLKNVYAIFDQGGLRLGLAQKVKRSVIFQFQRNPISQDEVDARRTLGLLPIKDAFDVVVDGFSADELGVHGPNDFLNNDPLNVTSPISNMTITPTGNIPETGDWGTEFQRFTFTYDVGFINDDPFNFTGESQDFPLNVTAGKGPKRSTSALLTLMKLPDPFILHGDPSWLSVDLRVFAVRAGQPAFSGSPLTVNDATGCPQYIQTLMSTITVDQFDNGLSTSEEFSKLFTQSTDGQGHNVFNFALAKVHYIGTNPNPFDVRVFFRLFQAQSTTGQFDFTPGMPATQPAQYRRGTNGDGQPIPLAGFLGNEYCTIPFFASPRINSTGASMTTQTDKPNIQTFTPKPDGSEVIKFYGCWLDLNQPFRTSSSSGLVESNAVLPVHVPSSNVDGPFPTDAVPIQSLVRATHECLIAELDYTPTPIPLGKDTNNWDKLAQRNIAYSDAGSATAVTPFEIKPTILPPLPADQTPDEIMIDWGSTRAKARAHIYLPAIKVSDILTMASLMYPSNRLTRVDDHTLGCRVGGITYVPIPPSTGTTGEANYAGLISIEMADGLTKGDVFNVVVRQVTNASGSIITIPIIAVAPTIPRQPQIAASTDSNDLIWRRVSGIFQLTIPVGDKAVLLPREINDYAVLLYIAQSIPSTSRWSKVFTRYLEIVAGRVTAFGGDPTGVLPSPTGDKCDGLDDEYICCSFCCIKKSACCLQ